MTDLEFALFIALRDLTDIVECQPSYDGFEEELEAANDVLEQYKRTTIDEAAKSAQQF